MDFGFFSCHPFVWQNFRKTFDTQSMLGRTKKMYVQIFVFSSEVEQEHPCKPGHYSFRIRKWKSFHAFQFNSMGTVSMCTDYSLPKNIISLVWGGFEVCFCKNSSVCVCVGGNLQILEDLLICFVYNCISLCL